MAAVRRLTSVPVVLGGSGFTIMPAAFMRELGSDFGIAGEGERAFPQLLQDISSGRKMEIGSVSPGKITGPGDRRNHTGQGFF